MSREIHDFDVSIIVPVYNRQDTIVDSLRSLLVQTVPPSEIIVINDGSTDDTKARIEDIGVEFEERGIRFLYKYQTNAGKAAALNRGIQLAGNNWIAFNDSDDIWRTDKLEIQRNCLEEFPSCNAAFSDCRYINNSSLDRSPFEIRGLKVNSKYSKFTDSLMQIVKSPYGIYMQTMIVNRSVANKVFPLDNSLKVSQDIDLLFRIAMYTDFCYTGQKLVDIDRTPTRNDNLTKEYGLKSIHRLETMGRIFNEWRKAASQRKDLRRSLSELVSNNRQTLGYELRQLDRRKEARAAFINAFKENPSLKNVIRMFWSIARCF